MEAVNELFQALRERLVKNDIARLKGLLNNSLLFPVMLEECKTFSDIYEQLVVTGHIQPTEKNGFQILKDLFRQMLKMDLVDMITEHERTQGKIQAPYGHTVTRSMARLAMQAETGAQAPSGHTLTRSMDSQPIKAETGAQAPPGHTVTRSMDWLPKKAETGAQALTPVQTTTCAFSDDGLRSDRHLEEDNKWRMRKLHADLAVELKRIIPPDRLTSLMMYVGAYLGIGELDGIETFVDLWRELQKRGEIMPGRYDILESAFMTIHPSFLQIIQEFKEKMKNEDGRYEGWIRDNSIVNSVAELKKLKKDYRSLLLKSGRHGVIFRNACISLIGAEGGELRLLNGSATLEVPPGAVDRDHLFWMFSGNDEKAQFSLKAANESLANRDGIVKYSLPVRLGPSGLDFKIPALLTLRDFSQSSTEKSMAVYRKTDSLYHVAGSCFVDKGINDFTARMSLSHFSGYILGMSVLSNPAPLNVRVMIHRKAETNGDRNQINVFFSANDYDYNQELIRSNSINAECTTCFYVDPKRDVTVILIRRIDEMTSDRRSEVVLHHHYIQNLPEMPVLLTIGNDSDGGSRGQDHDCQDTLIIEQDGQSLLHQSLCWPEGLQPFNQRQIEENHTSLRSLSVDQSRLHADMCQHVHQSLIKEEFMDLKAQLRGEPGITNIRALHEATTVRQLVDLLEEHGKVRPGENDFEFLKKQFRQMKKMTVVDIITKHQQDQEKQKKLKTQAGVAGNSQGTKRERPVHQAAGDGDGDKQGKAGSYETSSGSKRKKRVHPAAGDAGGAGDGNKQGKAGSSETSSGPKRSKRVRQAVGDVGGAGDGGTVHQTGDVQGAGNFQNVQIRNFTVVNKSISKVAAAHPTGGHPEDD